MKLLTTLLALVCLFQISQPVSGQNDGFDKMYKKSLDFIKDGDYKAAIPLLKRVEANDPENIDVQYQLAHCYLNTAHGPDSAVIHFIAAEELLKPEMRNTDFGIDVNMSLAKSYQRTYNYEKAIETYSNILSFIPEDFVDLKEVIKREIETSQNGIELMKNPVELDVYNLGAVINSKYDDHTPVVSADESELFFTSKRKSSYSQKIPNGQFSEKIYHSKYINGEWKESEIITSILDENSHESVLSISPDGSEMYLLRSNIDGSLIYVSNYDGETWSEPYKLPKGINSRFNETHASISADKSILLFTSDRPGGYGGLDIYYVRKIPNGEWGVPVNLGPKINTEFDEETPMLHPGGRTLYFSSEGHNSMGGFDIFYSSILPDSTFTNPINMGYPINTPDDDIFFVPTASTNKAYMASSRFDSNIGGIDIYQVEYEEPEIERMAVLKGAISNDADLPMAELKILVKNEETVVGKYKVNPEDNTYLMILEADKSYDIVYSGDEFETYTKEIEVNREMTYHNRENLVNIDPVQLVTLKAPEESNTIVGDAATHKEATKTSGTSNISGADAKYTIQFLTLKKEVDLTTYFNNLDMTQVDIVKCKDGNVRYLYGAYNSYSEAKKAKSELLKIVSYKDPFVRYIYQIEEMRE
ncbi:tetratricopeptide repeat protein [Saccharicrinis aurantiacus]|uniref:tetratricopeptide repeat protein n=1 Tax=Saccharicrinis aurantiacus TaxID=1849719 RepID=UPI00094FCD0C|nr:tetratricopeptide repeat protein [Saccharicrinis aurantiacus]